eukprot:7005809-Alexandrium_andersonii.AAC.1
MDVGGDGPSAGVFGVEPAPVVAVAAALGFPAARPGPGPVGLTAARPGPGPGRHCPSRPRKG